MSTYKLCERRDEWGEPYYEICSMHGDEPHSINLAAKTVAEVREMVAAALAALDAAEVTS